MIVLLKVHDILCLLFVIVGTRALQCMDDTNNPVDWFVVYKLPKINHHQELIKDGVAYIYMTSTDYGNFKLSNKSINSTDSIIGNTLKPLYSNKKEIMNILYNDEPPHHAAISSKGHTKGAILSDNKSGYWLIHSVPHFPELGHQYTFPETGSHYGQSFLCITMNLENLNSVGVQLQYNQPIIYDENILRNLESSLPDLIKAASNVTIRTPPWYSVKSIVSEKGAQFTSFAKSSSFNKELYEDLVAPTLETDLVVETWPNGPGRLKSNCTNIFKIVNVESISMNVAGVSFSATHDHSKWGVSTLASKSSWICIGDINRAEHQLLRGGGTVCLKNKGIAKNYQKLVQITEDCKTNFV